MWDKHEDAAEYRVVVELALVKEGCIAYSMNFGLGAATRSISKARDVISRCHEQARESIAIESLNLIHHTYAAYMHHTVHRW